MYNTKKVVIIDNGDKSELMNYVRNFDINIPLNDKVYEEEVIKILKIYNRGKIKKIGYVFWCNIYEEIFKLESNNDVTGVYFEYIDRGVDNWYDLDDLLRDKFPNMDNITVSQNFGRNNLEDSKCDLVILNTLDVFECKKKDIIYMKKFYNEIENFYKDYIDEDYMYLIVVKLSNQIQIILTDEEPNYL